MGVDARARSFQTLIHEETTGAAATDENAANHVSKNQGLNQLASIYWICEKKNTLRTWCSRLILRKNAYHERICWNDLSCAAMVRSYRCSYFFSSNGGTTSVLLLVKKKRVKIEATTIFSWRDVCIAIKFKTAPCNSLHTVHHRPHVRSQLGITLRGLTICISFMIFLYFAIWHFGILFRMATVRFFSVGGNRPSEANESESYAYCVIHWETWEKN